MLQNEARGFKFHNKSKISLLCDVTDVEYYGDRTHEFAVCSKPKNGTCYLNRYFTACILTPKYKIPVYVRPIRKNDSLSPELLIGEIFEALSWWLPISRIIADAFISSWNVLRELQFRNVEFLFNQWEDRKTKQMIQASKQSLEYMAKRKGVEVENRKNFYQWLKKNNLLTKKWLLSPPSANIEAPTLVLHAVLTRDKKNKSGQTWLLKFYSYSTNISASGSYLHKLYSFRWGIETQYRVTDLASLKRRGVRSVSFVDDNITLDHRHFSALCDGIVEHGLHDLHYSIQTSVKGLFDPPGLLPKLVRAGFRIVFLGIENPNPRNLVLFNKNVSDMAKKADYVVSYLRSHGVIVIGGLILGSPEDTVHDFASTLRYAQKVQLDLPLFFPLQPYPGVPLRENLLDQGLVFNPDDLSRYDGFTVNCRTHHLSPEEVEILVGQMWDHYFDRQWLFRNNIRRLYPTFLARALLRFMPVALSRSYARLFQRKNTRQMAEMVLQFEHEWRTLQR